MKAPQISIPTLFFALLLIGCGGEPATIEQTSTIDSVDVRIQQPAADAESNETAGHAHYRCPMDCEKGKVYHEEGTCGVCGMEMKQLTEH